MKAYEVNGALYVFETEATAIEAQTSVQNIYVETKYVDAFKEANATAVAEMIQGYNFNTMTVNAKPFAGHEDDDYPPSEPTEEPTEEPTTPPDPVDPDLSWYGLNRATMENESIGTTGISISQEIGPDQGANIYQDIWVNNPYSLQLTFNSTDTNVATIDHTTGYVAFIGAGQADLTASYSGDSEYKAQEISMSVYVTDTPMPDPVEPEEP